MICPKCKYERTANDNVPEWQCPNCGVAYNKVQKIDEQKNRLELENLENSDEDENSRRGSGKIILIITIFVAMVLFGYQFLGHQTRVRSATYPVFPTLDPAVKIVEHDFEAQGFRGIPWGADESTIQQMLGDSVVKLPNPVKYHNLHVDFTIPQYSIGGILMEAHLQMDDSSNGLARVLLIRRANPHPELPDRTFDKDYNSLKEILSQRYGTGIPVRKAEIQWVKDDFMINLDYFFQIGIDDQLTVKFVPRSNLISLNEFRP